MDVVAKAVELVCTTHPEATEDTTSHTSASAHRYCSRPTRSYLPQQLLQQYLPGSSTSAFSGTILHALLNLRERFNAQGTGVLKPRSAWVNFRFLLRSRQTPTLSIPRSSLSPDVVTPSSRSPRVYSRIRRDTWSAKAHPTTFSTGGGVKQGTRRQRSSRVTETTASRR
ncbi:hypothetical protein EI94DRAFT_1831644 [Lactarius quietus]|nr:hypothetical protein EI94DRAFT_1831644 [Lactarius quietus]